MAYVSQTNIHDTQTSEATPGIFIHDDTNPRAAIVHVFGEATFADTAALESIIVGVIRIGRPVIVDMRECNYMDCAAIGVLVRAAKNLGELLHLVIPRHSQGYRMLDLVGLARVLQVHDSLEDALSSHPEKPVATLRSV